MPFDRKIFFDSVRPSLFNGAMTQQQVDGMNYKITAFEERAPAGTDLRWLANAFATSYHETSATMWPIEEYGKGQGKEYGKPDPVTGLIYYGRGDVQLTWADNYKKATQKLALTGDYDLYWHPEKVLEPPISARIMMRGMYEGWFRPPNKFDKFFNATVDDPFGAREIINGDKNVVPSWSGGVSIGKLIAGYHQKFLTAFKASWIDVAPEPEPEPTPEPEPEPEVAEVRIETTGKVRVIVNGMAV